MPRTEIPTARQVFNTCGRLSGIKKRNDPMNQVLSILLTSALVGPNEKKIAAHLDYDVAEVSVYAKNIKAKKIWWRGRVNATWKDDKWGSIPLLHDAMSVLGLRANEERSQ